MYQLRTCQKMKTFTYATLCTLLFPLLSHAALLDVRISNLRPDGKTGTTWDLSVTGYSAGWSYWAKPVNCSLPHGPGVAVALLFKVNGRFSSGNQASYGGGSIGTIKNPDQPIKCGTTYGDMFYPLWNPLHLQGPWDVTPNNVKTVEACVGIQQYGTVLDVTCSDVSRPIVVPPPVGGGGTCNVSSGSNLTVSFGQIERNDLTSSESSAYKVTKQLTITCTGNETENFSVKLSGASDTQWNNSALATNNSNVGYVLKMNNKIMRNGTSQQMTVRGVTSSTLDFYAVKKPDINNSNISTGAFNSSATLIVTKQ